MLTKSFSLAAVIALAGSVSWMGCSDDPAASTGTTPDAGTNSQSDSGSRGSDSGTGADDDAGSKEDSGDFTGVDISYGKCPDFTKCGGDIVGSWTVSGGCVPDDAFAGAKAQCEGLQESDVVIKANGTVVATATTIERKVNVHVSAKVTVPKSCSPLPDCSLIAAGLQTGALPGAPKFEKATCADSGANCDCDVAGTVAEETTDDYTAADGVVTTTDASGDRTYEYCVQGNKTTYKETTAPVEGEFTLPIIVELTK